MKVSVLTATYNRCEDIEKLYNSLVVNKNSGVEFEWLIMDDGSTDKTKLVVDGFLKQGIIDVKYFTQHNMGKMVATNNLMSEVTGDICFTCDSDDYLTVEAMDIIRKHSKVLLEDDGLYALCFLKKNEKGNISGRKFPENFMRTDMFSLYFRENMTGEKCLVFKTAIRKKYHHEVEGDEKFVTESRMYNKMDLDYDILCINEVLEIGDYKRDGYTKNYLEYFRKAPNGYYEYFRELLELDLTGVAFKKKMYIYKHYILFAVLANRKHAISRVLGFRNKLIIALLWIPGKIKTKKQFKIKNMEKKENGKAKR